MVMHIDGEIGEDWWDELNLSIHQGTNYIILYELNLEIKRISAFILLYMSKLELEIKIIRKYKM